MTQTAFCDSQQLGLLLFSYCIQKCLPSSHLRPLHLPWRPARTPRHCDSATVIDTASSPLILQLNQLLSISLQTKTRGIWQMELANGTSISRVMDQPVNDIANALSSPYGQRGHQVAATDSRDFTDSVGRNFVTSLVQQDKEMLDAAHRKMPNAVRDEENRVVFNCNMRTENAADKPEDGWANGTELSPLLL